MVLLHRIRNETKLIGKHSESLSAETPVDLIFSAIQMLCIAITVTYDIVQLFEKNLRKEMYCEAMNELLNVTELVIFKNLTMQKICEKLQKCELQIITMVIITTSCLSYLGATMNAGSGLHVSFLNFLYFNSHVFLIVIDCLHIGQLFVTLNRFLEHLSNKVKNSGESTNKVKYIEIHKRVGNIIQKLVKAHEIEIILSYMAVQIFISSSTYLAYAFQNDFIKFADFGFFIILTNSPLLVVFNFTWKLVEAQNMVSVDLNYESAI